jgi:hypothetical protein
LGTHLPFSEVGEDGWAAERLLSKRFKESGVIMLTGEVYHAPNPDRFRVIFSVEEDTLREGIKRSGFRPFARAYELRSVTNSQTQNVASFSTLTFKLVVVVDRFRDDDKL